MKTFSTITTTQVTKMKTFSTITTTQVTKMKTFSTITLIQSLQTLLFIISISTIHARILPNDITVITSTCSRTPYPNKCIAALIFYPGTERLAKWGLAGVLLNNIMKIKANIALDKIHQLQKAGPNKGLDSCARKYNAILKTHIPKANAAYEKDDFKGAAKGASDAANEASSCENAFPGHITKVNSNMHDIAADTAAVFKSLHVRSGY